MISDAIAAPMAHTLRLKGRNKIMNKISTALCLTGLVLSLAGCATVGRDFPEAFASKIVLNQMTRAEVEKQLGAPFRTGLDSGNPTATYLYYYVGLFIDPITKDLTVTYTPQGTVKAYTFNSNEHSEKDKQDYTNR